MKPRLKTVIAASDGSDLFTSLDAISGKSVTIKKLCPNSVGTDVADSRSPLGITVNMGLKPV